LALCSILFVRARQRGRGAAAQFDRPVQWVETRSENSLDDSHGPDHVTTAALAFDDDELNRYTVE